MPTPIQVLNDAITGAEGTGGSAPQGATNPLTALSSDIGGSSDEHERATVLNAKENNGRPGDAIGRETKVLVANVRAADSRSKTNDNDIAPKTAGPLMAQGGSPPASRPPLRTGARARRALPLRARRVAHRSSSTTENGNGRDHGANGFDSANKKGPNGEEKSPKEHLAQTATFEDTTSLADHEPASVGIDCQESDKSSLDEKKTSLVDSAIASDWDNDRKGTRNEKKEATAVAYKAPATHVRVTIIKPSKCTKLGIQVDRKQSETRVQINSIFPDSLFAKTDLSAGMIIESINGRTYSSFDEGLSLLTTAEGALTIVAARRQRKGDRGRTPRGDVKEDADDQAAADEIEENAEVETQFTRANPHRHDWSRYFYMLIEYKRANGHVSVPLGHILYTWIAQQRAYSDFLSQEQRLALLRLGVRLGSQFVRSKPNVLTEESGTAKTASPAKKEPVKEEPEKWEAKIIERNQAHPWWKNLKSKNPEQQQETLTQRSARLNQSSQTLSEEEEMEDEEEKDGAEELSSKADDDANCTEVISSREKRAKRRLARFGEVPDPPPPKKKLVGACKAAQEKKNALIDRFLRARKNNSLMDDIVEEEKDAGADEIDDNRGNDPATSTASGVPQKMSPPKSCYTESDISKGELLNQPCTILDGRLTSGLISLTLPLLPSKLGLFIRDNDMFGFPELVKVSESSPIGMQIPLDFRTDCFITSIESLHVGRITPKSGNHCAEIFNTIRGNLPPRVEARATVNFAKNPVTLYISEDDPLRTGEALNEQ